MTGRPVVPVLGEICRLEGDEGRFGLVWSRRLYIRMGGRPAVEVPKLPGGVLFRSTGNDLVHTGKLRTSECK